MGQLQSLTEIQTAEVGGPNGQAPPLLPPSGAPTTGTDAARPSPTAADDGGTETDIARLQAVEEYIRPDAVAAAATVRSSRVSLFTAAAGSGSGQEWLLRQNGPWARAAIDEWMDLQEEDSDEAEAYAWDLHDQHAP